MAIILGGHISAAGGISQVIERALNLQFTCLQIHPSQPQRWQPIQISNVELGAFQQDNQLVQLPLFLHAPYLINLASLDPVIAYRSVQACQDYLSWGDKLGSQGIPVHLGSHKGAGLEAVLPTLQQSLTSVLQQASSTPLLIENTAGAGGSLGKAIPEIRQILASIPEYQDRLGLCIDSCHAFAAGIPIHTKSGLNEFLIELDESIGLEKLACIHLNDCKFPFASQKDRHANIGDGFIGDQGFVHLLQHPRLQEVPFILEVPGLNNEGPDAANRDRVIKIATS